MTITPGGNPPTRHSHMTRDIRPKGSGCPACDQYWNQPVCYCTRVDGLILEDPTHPCAYHHPKENK